MSSSDRFRSKGTAIIGMACVYAEAKDLAHFWHNILNKVDAIRNVSPKRGLASFYDPDPAAEDRIYCQMGGWLDDSFPFDAMKYGTPPRSIEGAEPDQFLVLRTVYEAMENAGYLDKDIDGERISVILGKGNYLGQGVWNLLQRTPITVQTRAILKGLHPEFSEEQLGKIQSEIRSKLPGFGAETAPGLIPNITTGRVANRLNFMGRNFTVDAACASTLVATELGIRGLESGQDDLVFVGGVHVSADVSFMQVFDAMNALSLSSKIQPYSENCDGTMVGEGVGILVLKRLEDAERDGDRIYAVIRGVGVASDGRAKGVTAPRVEGEELAVRRAYQMCGVDADTVELIEGHGTATPVGDAAEIETMQRVFGPRGEGPPTCAVGSVKSMIGHAMPAAGAAGMIKTALSLYHGVYPPTLNCGKPAPALVNEKSRFYVSSETRPWVHATAEPPRRAGVNAFGFGGINAHVVLEEYRDGTDATRPTLIRDWESELLVIDAASRGELSAKARRLADYAGAVSGVDLRDVASTLYDSLGHDHRLCVVASSLADLRSKLDQAAKRLDDPGVQQIKDRKGIFYFDDSPLRGAKTALLLPGEGSQYVNMLADLSVHFPEVRRFFDKADGSALVRDGHRLSSDIFPPPLLSEENTKKLEERLLTIERATEAVLTADFAVLQLLGGLGFQADMITGHSAGEWVALAASGIVDVEELVSGMGRLEQMYRAVRQDATVPSMGMLAVGAGRQKVEALAREIDRTVYVANDNCNHQVVVVVDPADTEPVRDHFTSRGVFTEKLPYDRGYHTPAFTYICEPLREFFSTLRLRKPKTPIYCCTTAERMPDDPEAILGLVTNTFTRPLLFRQTVEAMYEDGARIFVEAGPRGNLTAFVDDILRGRPHVAVPIDQFRRPGLTTLNHALGLLMALHVPLDLGSLYARRSPRQLTLDVGRDREAMREAPGTVQIPLHYSMLECPTAVTADIRMSAVGAEEASRPVASEGAGRSPGAGGSGTADPLPHDLASAGSNGQGDSASFEREPVLSRPADGSMATKALEEHFQVMENFLEMQESVMRSYLELAGARKNTPPAAVRGVEAPTVVTEPDAAKEVAWKEASPPPAEAPEAVAPAEVEAGSAAAPGQLREVLLQVVSDRTGYPQEMLDLDLDMEADLGIDSIKRVEIMGALKELAGGPALGNEGAVEEIAQLKTLGQILQYLEAAAGPGAEGERSEAAPAGPDDLTGPLLQGGRIVRAAPGREIVVEVEISQEDHLYLGDHRLIKKNSDQDDAGRGPAIVPSTVAFEMMAEVAAMVCPGLKIVGARDHRMNRWIEIGKESPAVLTITARKAAETEVEVSIERNDAGPATSPNGTKLGEAAIRFDRDYPAAPSISAPPLEDARQPACSAREMYENGLMFHGESFQGVASLDSIGNGIDAQLRVLPIENLLRSEPAPAFHVDPFLLDAAGQVVGFWPLESASEGSVMFPVRLAELTLYRENLPPGTTVQCFMRIQRVTPTQISADFDVVGPDGKLWIRVHGWEDWRFYLSQRGIDFLRKPDKVLFCDRVELPPELSDVECWREGPEFERDLGSEFFEGLWTTAFLSEREREEYRRITDPRARKIWAGRRVAAKDAVRAWVKRRHGRELYPADIDVVDGVDRPFRVSGRWTEEVGEVPDVSIPENGNFGIAASGRDPDRAVRLAMSIGGE